MVTLNPTTAEAGASSPVTNTLPCAFEPPPEEEEEFVDPQPIPNMLSASSNPIPKNFFMAGSDAKVLFVKWFPGVAVICFTTMETQPGAECRVTKERLPGRSGTASSSYLVGCEGVVRCQGQKQLQGMYFCVTYRQGRAAETGCPELLSAADLTFGKLRRALLQLQHFLLFALAHVFHLLDFAVGQLLNFVERALLFVLGNFLVLQRLFDGVVAVAANVANGRAMLFQ